MILSMLGLTCTGPSFFEVWGHCSLWHRELATITRSHRLGSRVRLTLWVTKPPHRGLTDPGVGGAAVPAGQGLRATYYTRSAPTSFDRLGDY